MKANSSWGSAEVFVVPIPAFILESNAFRNDWNWTSSLESIFISYRFKSLRKCLSSPVEMLYNEFTMGTVFHLLSLLPEYESCKPIINLFHGGGLEIKRETYIHLVGFQFDYCGVQPRLGKRWLTTMYFVEFSVGFSLFLFARFRSLWLAFRT